MRIEGNLPKLPNEWQDKLYDEHPNIGPRLKTHFDRTVYTHAFAMQPKRHGKYQQIYPELKLEQEDFDFAFDRLDRWERGLNFIRKQLKGKATRGGVREKVFVMFGERKSLDTQEVSNELGVSEAFITNPEYDDNFFKCRHFFNTYREKCFNKSLNVGSIRFRVTNDHADCPACNGTGEEHNHD